MIIKYIFDIYIIKILLTEDGKFIKILDVKLTKEEAIKRQPVQYHNDIELYKYM